MGNSWECTTRELPREEHESDLKLTDQSWSGDCSSTSSVQFCLHWNNYQTNLTKVFDQLLQSESFVDVTLACDGQSLKAHKVVLSACSPYFQMLFFDNPCQHPIVIMKDVTWAQLKAIVEFMYKGEIKVSQDELAPLLKVAEMLKIRGLTEVNADNENSKLTDSLASCSKEIQLMKETPVTGDETPKVKTRKRNSAALKPDTSSLYTDISSSFLTSPANKCLTPPKNTTLLSQVPSVSSFPSVGSYASITIDDIDMKSVCLETNREDVLTKTLKMFQNSPSASTSAPDFTVIPMKNYNKAMTWTQEQLQEAIHAVVTQKMRFTQASAAYGIPKGTLYDNILGKSKRMLVLDEAGLSDEEEKTVLDFCCDVSISPYNRRTKRSLATVLEFVERLRRNRDPEFTFTGLAGFRWWWAFCKKHSIVSLYYDNKSMSNSTNVDTPA